MRFSLNSDLEVDEMPNPEDTQRRIEGGDQADQATQVRSCANKFAGSLV
jgi:hypothetical protein